MYNVNIGIFVIISLVLMPLIMIRLSKQGTSRDLKIKIMVRYTALFLVFIPQYLRLYSYVFGDGHISAFELYMEGIITILIVFIRI